MIAVKNLPDDFPAKHVTENRSPRGLDLTNMVAADA
jgi:hypothetical protein